LTRKPCTGRVHLFGFSQSDGRGGDESGTTSGLTVRQQGMMALLHSSTLRLTRYLRARRGNKVATGATGQSADSGWRSGEHEPRDRAGSLTRADPGGTPGRRSRVRPRRPLRAKSRFGVGFSPVSPLGAKSTRSPKGMKRVDVWVGEAIGLW